VANNGEKVTRGGSRRCYLSKESIVYTAKLSGRTKPNFLFIGNTLRRGSPQTSWWKSSICYLRRFSDIDCRIPITGKRFSVSAAKDLILLD